jgi:hypothetical protein
MRDTVVVPRWITAWRSERVSLACRLPPDAALRHIHAGIDARHPYQLWRRKLSGRFGIIGRADDRGIRIAAADRFIDNSFRVHLHARLLPDGAGSRLEGSFGWLPGTRVFAATMALILGTLWFMALGFVGRTVVIGGPVWRALAALLIVTAFVLFHIGLVAGGERLSRSEAAHLRAWIADRLDVPAPPPRTAPVPRPRTPPPAIRPPAPT